MTDNFDIARFAKKLADEHPDLADQLEGTSETTDFDKNDFERKIVSELPALAETLCKFDGRREDEAKEKTVSKKQQARDREARLESMMTEGRSVIEKRAPTFHDQMLTTKGPMSMLATAVINQKAVEVRTRSAIRIDRIFVGIPTTFDEHFNLMMKDVTETVLHGRKAQKEVWNRKCLQELLPEFLRWKDGGTWPMQIGEHRLLQNRFQRSCFIKGESVVLIRRL